MPLFLQVCAVSSLAMWLPAVHALVQRNHDTARSFFYGGLMGLIVVTLIALAMASRPSRHSPLSQLLSLFATFVLLPAFLAVPFHDALKTTTFFNAYVEMVSAVTTTGATLFEPSRLNDSLHLWRAEVGWLGGFLMWVAASAVLAPLSLGGFEVTSQGAPGRAVSGPMRGPGADPRHRLARTTLTLAPIYIGLTATVWVLLLIAGERSLVALCHAMSVMATSGISPVDGMEGARAGMTGESILFLFMFFALSRLTFSSDTVARGHARLDRDPEFRIGLLLVLVLPILLFLRHWIGALEANEAEDAVSALRAYWGATFTVLSFLTTTGFASADWTEAQQWSGLATPGMILLGLAVIGGGVATTAGGVKLLRVFALYLNGTREMQRLVHPSSVAAEGMESSRIQRHGALNAFIFFMLFAISLAVIAAALAALGSDFESALVLAVAALSTTGPLTEFGAADPISLIELNAMAKAVFAGAMVLGRLEMLAIIALLTPDLWRN
ncbi:TrkH family potassium uptake protein [Seohaeicola nanhaiensis]|uniref:TrkH family potassium uptake protein n=1 Tax=Seohaeicola nanhaiensis TaxID=1387282 RepID=A0ABV9KF70_9RHOB